MAHEGIRRRERTLIGPCPLCRDRELGVFLERPDVPVHQNFPLETKAEARAVARGDLQLACCHGCGFITNVAFRPELLKYGAGYENDQTLSPRFEAHMEGLVAGLLDEGVRGKTVIEVGCGQGHFLRSLCARGGNLGIGFDPAYPGPETVDDGRVRFVRDFYGPQHAYLRADAVVCRHVIEHVPDPLALLGALEGVGAALVAFETPTVDWILNRTVIQDFFYEHCSYFTPESISYAFGRAQFRPLSVDRIFEGQYMWIRARRSANLGDVGLPPAEATAATVEAASAYGRREQQRLRQLRAKLEQLRAAGPLAVWGAGAKGVTFLNLLDADAALVDCVVDINPRKRGKYVPGTAHAIVGIEDLRARQVRSAIVMNANYLEEIRTSLQLAGLNLELKAEGDM